MALEAVALFCESHLPADRLPHFRTLLTSALAQQSAAAGNVAQLTEANASLLSSCAAKTRANAKLRSQLALLSLGPGSSRSGAELAASSSSDDEGELESALYSLDTLSAEHARELSDLEARFGAERSLLVATTQGLKSELSEAKDLLESHRNALAREKELSLSLSQALEEVQTTFESYRNDASARIVALEAEADASSAVADLDTISVTLHEEIHRRSALSERLAVADERVLQLERQLRNVEARNVALETEAASAEQRGADSTAGLRTKLEESQVAAARRIRELEHSLEDEREANERLGEERDALQRKAEALMLRFEQMRAVEENRRSGPVARPARTPLDKENLVASSPSGPSKQLRGQVTTLTREKAQLQAEKADLVIALDVAQRELESMTSQTAMVTRRKGHLQAALVDAEESLNELRQEAAAAAETIARLESENASLDVALADRRALVAERDELYAASETAAHRLHALGGAHAELQALYDDLRVQFEALLGAYTRIKTGTADEISHLRAALEAATTIESLSFSSGGSCSEADAAELVVEDEVAALHEALPVLSAFVDETMYEEQEASTHIAVLQRRLDDAVREANAGPSRDAVGLRLASVREARAAATALAGALETSVLEKGELADRVRQLANQVAALEASNAWLAEGHEQLASESAAVQDANDALASENQTLCAEREALAGAVNKLRLQLGRLVADKKELHTQLVSTASAAEDHHASTLLITSHLQAQVEALIEQVALLGGLHLQSQMATPASGEVVQDTSLDLVEPELSSLTPGEARRLARENERLRVELGDAEAMLQVYASEVGMHRRAVEALRKSRAAGSPKMESWLAQVEAAREAAESALVAGAQRGVGWALADVEAVRDGAEELVVCLGELAGEADSLRARVAGLEAAEAKVAEIEPKLEAAEAKVAEIEPKLEAAEAKVAEIEPKLEAAEAKVAEIEPKLEAAEAKVAEIEPKLEAAEAKVAELEVAEAKVAEIEPQLAAAEARVTELEAVEAKLAEIEPKLEAAEAKVAELEAAKAKVAEIEPQLEAAEAKVAEIEPQLAAAEARVTELEAVEAKLAEIEPKLEAAEAKVAELEVAEAKVAEIEPQLAAAEARVTELEAAEAKVAEIEPQLAAAEARVTELEAVEAKLAEIEPKLEAAEARVTELEVAEAKVAEIEPQLAAAEARVTELEAAEAKVAEIEPQLAAAEARVTELEAVEAKLAEIEPKLEAAEARVTELEAAEAKVAELEAAEAKLAEIEPKLAATEAKVAELEVAEAKVAEIEPQLAAAEARVTELEAAEAKVAEIEPQLEAAEAKVAEIEPQLAAAEARVTELEAAEAKLAEIEPQLEAAEAKVAELEAAEVKVAEIEPQLEAAEAKLAEIEPKLEAAEARVAELEAARANKVAEIEPQLAAAEAKAAELEVAEAKVAEIEPQLAAAEARVTELEAVEAKLAEIEPKLEAAEAKVAELEAAEAKVAEIEPQLEAAEAKVAEIEPKLAVAEARVAELEVAETRVVELEVQAGVLNAHNTETDFIDAIAAEQEPVATLAAEHEMPRMQSTPVHSESHSARPAGNDLDDAGRHAEQETLRARIAELEAAEARLVALEPETKVLALKVGALETRLIELQADAADAPESRPEIRTVTAADPSRVAPREAIALPPDVQEARLVDLAAVQAAASRVVDELAVARARVAELEHEGAVAEHKRLVMARRQVAELELVVDTITRAMDDVNATREHMALVEAHERDVRHSNLQQSRIKQLHAVRLAADVVVAELADARAGAQRLTHFEAQPVAARTETTSLHATEAAEHGRVDALEIKLCNAARRLDEARAAASTVVGDAAVAHDAARRSSERVRFLETKLHETSARLAHVHSAAHDVVGDLATAHASQDAAPADKAHQVVAKTEAELVEARAQIAELAQVVATVHDAMADVAAAKHRIDELEGELAAARDFVAGVESGVPSGIGATKVYVVDRQYEVAAEKLAALQAAADDVVGELAAAHDHIVALQAAETDEVSERVAELEVEFDAVRAHAADLEPAAAAAEEKGAETEAVQERVAVLEAELSAARDHIAELEAAASAVDVPAVAPESTTPVLETEDETEDELEAARAKIVQLEQVAAVVHEAMDDVAAAKRRNAELEAELEAARDFLPGARSVDSVVTDADVSGSLTLRPVAIDKLAAAQAAADDVVGELAAAHSRIAELEPAAAAAEEKGAETAAVQERVAVLEAELSAARDHIAELEAAASAVDVPAVAPESTTPVLETEDETEDELEAARAKIVQLEQVAAVVHEAMDDVAAAKRRNAELEAELEAARDFLPGARSVDSVVTDADVSGSLTLRPVAIDKLAAAQAAADDVVGELAAAHSRIAELEPAAAAAEEKGAETEAVQERVAVLEVELSAARDHIAELEAAAAAAEEKGPRQKPFRSGWLCWNRARVNHPEDETEDELGAARAKIVQLEHVAAVVHEAMDDVTAAKRRNVMLEADAAEFAASQRAAVGKLAAVQEAADDVVGELAVARDRIAELESGGDADLQGRVVALETELAAARHHISAIEPVAAAVEETVAEAEAAQRRLAVLEAELDAARTRIAQHESAPSTELSLVDSDAHSPVERQVSSADLTAAHARIADLEQVVSVVHDAMADVTAAKLRITELETELEAVPASGSGPGRAGMLESRLENATLQLVDVQAAADLVVSELAAAHDQLALMSQPSELGDLRERVAVLEAELAASRDYIAQLETDTDAVRPDLVEQLDSAHAQIAELKHAVAVVQDAMANVGSFQKRVDELEHELAVADDHIAELEARPSRPHLAPDSTEAELQADLDNARAQIADLRQVAAAVEDAVADVASAQKRVTELEQELALAKKRIASLEVELEAMAGGSAAAVELRAELDEARAQIAELKQVAAAVKDAMHNVAEAQDRVADLEADLAAANDYIVELESRRQPLGLALPTIMEESTVTSQPLDETKTVTELQSELTTARNQIAELKSVVAVVQGALTDVSSAQDRIFELERDLEAAMADVPRLEQELDVAHAHIVELESAVASIDDTVVEVEAAQARIIELEAEAEANHARTDSPSSATLKVELAAAHAHIAQLEIAVTTIQDTVAEVEAARLRMGHLETAATGSVAAQRLHLAAVAEAAELVSELAASAVSPLVAPSSAGAGPDAMGANLLAARDRILELEAVVATVQSAMADVAATRARIGELEEAAARAGNMTTSERESELADDLAAAHDRIRELETGLTAVEAVVVEASEAQFRITELVEALEAAEEQSARMEQAALVAVGEAEPDAAAVVNQLLAANNRIVQLESVVETVKTAMADVAEARSDMADLHAAVRENDDRPANPAVAAPVRLTQLSEVRLLTFALVDAMETSDAGLREELEAAYNRIRALELGGDASAGEIAAHIDDLEVELEALSEARTPIGALKTAIDARAAVASKARALAVEVVDAAQNAQDALRAENARLRVQLAAASEPDMSVPPGVARKRAARAIGIAQGRMAALRMRVLEDEAVRASASGVRARSVAVLNETKAQLGDLAVAVDKAEPAAAETAEALAAARQSLASLTTGEPVTSDDDIESLLSQQTAELREIQRRVSSYGDSSRLFADDDDEIEDMSTLRWKTPVSAKKTAAENMTPTEARFAAMRILGIAQDRMASLRSRAEAQADEPSVARAVRARALKVLGQTAVELDELGKVIAAGDEASLDELVGARKSLAELSKRVDSGATAGADAADEIGALQRSLSLVDGGWDSSQGEVVPEVLHLRQELAILQQERAADQARLAELERQAAVSYGGASAETQRVMALREDMASMAAVHAQVSTMIEQYEANLAELDRDMEAERAAYEAQLQERDLMLKRASSAVTGLVGHATARQASAARIQEWRTQIATARGTLEELFSTRARMGEVELDVARLAAELAESQQRERLARERAEALQSVALSVSAAASLQLSSPKDGLERVVSSLVFDDAEAELATAQELIRAYEATIAELRHELRVIEASQVAEASLMPSYHTQLEAITAELDMFVASQSAARNTIVALHNRVASYEAVVEKAHADLEQLVAKHEASVSRGGLGDEKAKAVAPVEVRASEADDETVAVSSPQIAVVQSGVAREQVATYAAVVSELRQEMDALVALKSEHEARASTHDIAQYAQVVDMLKTEIVSLRTQINTRGSEGLGRAVFSEYYAIVDAARAAASELVSQQAEREELQMIALEEERAKSVANDAKVTQYAHVVDMLKDQVEVLSAEVSAVRSETAPVAESPSVVAERVVGYHEAVQAAYNEVEVLIALQTELDAGRESTGAVAELKGQVARLQEQLAEQETGAAEQAEHAGALVAVVADLRAEVEALQFQVTGATGEQAGKLAEYAGAVAAAQATVTALVEAQTAAERARMMPRTGPSEADVSRYTEIVKMLRDEVTTLQARVRSAAAIGPDKIASYQEAIDEARDAVIALVQAQSGAAAAEARAAAEQAYVEAVAEAEAKDPVLVRVGPSEADLAKYTSVVEILKDEVRAMKAREARPTGVEAEQLAEYVEAVTQARVAAEAMLDAHVDAEEARNLAQLKNPGPGHVLRLADGIVQLRDEVARLEAVVIGRAERVAAYERAVTVVSLAANEVVQNADVAVSELKAQVTELEAKLVELVTADAVRDEDRHGEDVEQLRQRVQELESELEAAHVQVRSRSAHQRERDALRARVAELEAQVLAQPERLARLQASLVGVRDGLEELVVTSPRSGGSQTDTGRVAEHRETVAKVRDEMDALIAMGPPAAKRDGAEGDGVAVVSHAPLEADEDVHLLRARVAELEAQVLAQPERLARLQASLVGVRDGLEELIVTSPRSGASHIDAGRVVEYQATVAKVRGMLDELTGIVPVAPKRPEVDVAGYEERVADARGQLESLMVTPLVVTKVDSEAAARTASYEAVLGSMRAELEMLVASSPVASPRGSDGNAERLVEYRATVQRLTAELEELGARSPPELVIAEGIEASRVAGYERALNELRFYVEALVASPMVQNMGNDGASQALRTDVAALEKQVAGLSLERLAEYENSMLVVRQMAESLVQHAPLAASRDPLEARDEYEAIISDLRDEVASLQSQLHAESESVDDEVMTRLAEYERTVVTMHEQIERLASQPIEQMRSQVLGYREQYEVIIGELRAEIESLSEQLGEVRHAVQSESAQQAGRLEEYSTVVAEARECVAELVANGQPGMEPRQQAQYEAVVGDLREEVGFLSKQVSEVRESLDAAVEDGVAIDTTRVVQYVQTLSTVRRELEALVEMPLTVPAAGEGSVPVVSVGVGGERVFHYQSVLDTMRFELLSLVAAADAAAGLGTFMTPRATSPMSLMSDGESDVFEDALDEPIVMVADGTQPSVVSRNLATAATAVKVARAGRDVVGELEHLAAENERLRTEAATARAELDEARSNTWTINESESVEQLKTMPSGHNLAAAATVVQVARAGRDVVGELEQLSAENARLRAKLEQAHVEVANAGKVDRQSADQEQLLREELEQARAELRAMQAKAEGMEQLKTTPSGHNLAAAATVVQVARAGRDVVGELEQLSAENARLRAKLEQAHVEVANAGKVDRQSADQEQLLREELEQARAELRAMQAKAEGMEQLKTTPSGHNLAAAATVVQVARAGRDVVGELEQLSAENARLRAKLEQAHVEVANAGKVDRQSADQEQLLREELEQARAELRAMQAKAEGMEQLKTTPSGHNLAAAATVVQVARAGRDVVGELEQLSAENARLRTEAATARAELDEARSNTWTITESESVEQLKTTPSGHNLAAAATVVQVARAGRDVVGELEQLSADNERLRAKLGLAQAELAALKSVPVSDTARQPSEANKAKYRAMKAELEATKAELKSALSRIPTEANKAEYKVVKAELRETRAKLEGASAAVAELDETRERLEQTELQLNDALVELAGTRRMLRESHEALDAAPLSSGFQEELEETRDRLAVVLAELETMRAKAPSEANKAKYKAVKAELEETRAELEETQAELEETQAELEAALANASSEANKAKYKAVKAELQETQAELQETQAELETMRAKAPSEANKAKYKAVKAELQETQAELEETQAELEETQAELQETQAELEAALASAPSEANKAKYKAVKAELQETQAELEETQAELEETQAELQETQAELEAALASTPSEANKAKYKAVKAELQETRAELEDVKSAMPSMTDYTEALAKARSEAAALIDGMSTLVVTNEDLEARMASIQAANADLADVIARYEELLKRRKGEAVPALQALVASLYERLQSTSDRLATAQQELLSSRADHVAERRALLQRMHELQTDLDAALELAAGSGSRNADEPADLGPSLHARRTTVAPPAAVVAGQCLLRTSANLAVIKVLRSELVDLVALAELAPAAAGQL
ncbi:uncharacterized protein AMSG_04595 [Thecamonas trahens ATCC 50062]|uniref:Uncharacterized protein n=1 Tax=Thecamonas trahens ATCC 50062 TaxID=461836 RepID=A0A0L0D9D2_THETB|nr:hypothetical protein AMSG_04595 [Thecamonas trahens ATCC 50062]KNC48850.1 hypothetical protein AMSG_04595 [Thecamonas trahens ATCC 50062]|eukprot:XP_013758270.1 hypothetical protein AMSG_04595 [Thecamonas trahens ATCC 50062]